MRFCRLPLRREGVLGIDRLVVYLFRRYTTFAKSASYTVDDIGRSIDKMISDLNGSLGSRQFLNVANERTCFASCARAHLKVPGCSLVSVECTSD